MTDAQDAEPSADSDAASDLVIERLSREDGKNSTVRVYPDRIEWIKQMSISSMPRGKNDPPVIPLVAVAAVKAKKDGPLFSKVILRMATGQIVFRMLQADAEAVRDAIVGLLEGEAPSVLPPA